MNLAKNADGTTSKRNRPKDRYRLLQGKKQSYLVEIAELGPLLSGNLEAALESSLTGELGLVKSESEASPGAILLDSIVGSMGLSDVLPSSRSGLEYGFLPQIELKIGSGQQIRKSISLPIGALENLPKAKDVDHYRGRSILRSSKPAVMEFSPLPIGFGSQTRQLSELALLLEKLEESRIKRIGELQKQFVDRWRTKSNALAQLTSGNSLEWSQMSADTKALLASEGITEKATNGEPLTLAGCSLVLVVPGTRVGKTRTSLEFGLVALTGYTRTGSKDRP